MPRAAKIAPVWGWLSRATATAPAMVRTMPADKDQCFTCWPPGNTLCILRKTKQKEVERMSHEKTRQPATALIRHGAYLAALVIILWFLGRYVLPIVWALIERL